jgi:hypothetical protein
MRIDLLWQMSLIFRWVETLGWKEQIRIIFAVHTASVHSFTCCIACGVTEYWVLKFEFAADRIQFLSDMCNLDPRTTVVDVA